MLFSRESSRLRDLTQVSHIAGRFFTVWTTREAHHCLKVALERKPRDGIIFQTTLSSWPLLPLRAEIRPLPNLGRVKNIYIWD